MEKIGQSILESDHFGHETIFAGMFQQQFGFVLGIFIDNVFQ